MHGGESESLRTLYVFLASPGGLEAERTRVRSLIETLNLSFRRIGWRVELLRWEDNGPTAGRPQAEINRDVDRAHVFCGLLSDRWGTPTGESSSGFAEEWERSLERYRRSGAPELWIFFKDVASPKQPALDPQFRAVSDFRESIEREENAFHRTFTDPEDLSALVQRVLLDLVHRQAGMAAATGLPNLDWGVALAGEPVLLLPDGRAREGLAAELTESEPGRAAEIFLELASELEELGFPMPADVLRRRAASALSAAGRVEEALALWRRALSEALVGSHPVETDFSVRELREELPPERSWEARAWGACVNWTEDPEGARRDLRDGLGHGIEGGLDPATAVVWREVLWQLDLDHSDPGALLAEAPAENPGSTELELLLAEARSRQDSQDFRSHWAELRGRSALPRDGDLDDAALIAARWAFQLALLGELEEAGAEYGRAAGLWGRVADGEEEAAECFFSAQTAASLDGEFFPSGWG